MLVFFIIKGNTQMIEVVQTAPGKFVTASGHSIKTSTAAGGLKTIIRAATGNAQVLLCKYLFSFNFLRLFVRYVLG